MNYGLPCKSCNGIAFRMREMPAYGSLLIVRNVYRLDGREIAAGSPIRCEECGVLVRADDLKTDRIVELA